MLTISIRCLLSRQTIKQAASLQSGKSQLAFLVFCYTWGFDKFATQPLSSLAMSLAMGLLFHQGADNPRLLESPVASSASTKCRPLVCNPKMDTIRYSQDHIKATMVAAGSKPRWLKQDVLRTNDIVTQPKMKGPFQLWIRRLSTGCILYSYGRLRVT